MKNRLIEEDIVKIFGKLNIDLKCLNNSSVLIVGVTGQIGTNLAYTLSHLRKLYNLNLSVIGIARNSEKGENLRKLNLIDTFVHQDICKLIDKSKFSTEVDYIFHCAAITNSSLMISHPVDVITIAVNGTKNILDFAKEKKCKSFVYLSSMEIYGVTNKNEVNETDLGYIDLTSVRSCYPESKRMAEQLCIAYFNQYGLPIKIARLAQTFGAGTSKDDPRVYGQFVRSVMNQENIVLHTEGNSRGNYCYSMDAISALLTLLVTGKNGEIYNVANSKASVTIREMAEILGKEYELEVIVNVPVNDQNSKYPPKVGYILNTDKIKELSWEPTYEILDFYKRMIASNE